MIPALQGKINQFQGDSDLAHQIVNGDANTVVETAGGPVRSFAKVIQDNDAAINATGLLGEVQSSAAAAAGSASDAIDHAAAAANAATNATGAAGTAGTAAQAANASALSAAQSAMDAALSLSLFPTRIDGGRITRVPSTTYEFFGIDGGSP
ncbi:hypothetical protein PQR39_25755 [Paraburkholderia sediminicola]|uniref:hypothetical protein n=1 Tax=Paraburkholderia sediminicola TaxID=458836 RepID=UPI0038BE0000